VTADVSSGVSESPRVLIEDHAGEYVLRIVDDQLVPAGQKYASDAHVQVLCAGEVVRDFLYPAYRIWTLAAHWREELPLSELVSPTDPTPPLEA
jgi:hypothetical protein